MQTYSQLAKKMKNYQNIRSLVNLNFLQILGQYQVLSDNLQNQLAEAARLKEIYWSINREYNIKSSFFENLNKNEKPEQQKKLIIYIAEKAKYSSIGFHNTDNLILSTITKNDLLITMGDYACEWSKKAKIPVYDEYERIDVSYVSRIKTLIYELYVSKVINRVEMIFPSNKIENNRLIILPVEQNKLSVAKAPETIDIKNYSIHPNLSSFIDNLNLIYLDYTIAAAITEASFYSLKQKISRIKSLIESVEKKIEKLANDILKEKRKVATDDIIITTQ
ncbi:hypothetical protein CJJ23_02070 [Mycoplasmopsis agassizii]|uniref:ATP synthase gamma chain n=1 Tax=Mycoplasmopsis agassizii TaxID=33922 RepID=A0A269TIZ0_9BACT|nr:hypothetical protein [Mycoplasmopsis agassizii]PAK21414.1 hypothetical protein CJJ23_02070 [Mycoplasmopsis agassizii]